MAHLRRDTFPQLGQIPGFVGASILRRTVERGVEFLIVTRWKSLDAIQAFAGRDAEVAVVPDNVQRMMNKFRTRYAIILKAWLNPFQVARAFQ